MIIEEHVQTARDFLNAADTELAAGDTLQGSEKLWGALSHAMAAYCQYNQWPYGTHRKTLEAVDRLASQLPDGTSILLVASEARNFHSNFYNGNMEDYEVERGRPIVRAGVERILELMGENGAGGAG